MFKKLFILLCCLQISYAKVFEATGFGDTAELAKMDAVTNAIKFSVGEFIVNKEELNDDDFKQKVVGYSNGYVKHIEVKSQKQISETKYEVVVDVDIESQKLIGALKEMQIAVIENAVDNTALLEAINHFDKKDINAQNKEDFRELAEELLVTPIKENKELVHIDILGKLIPLEPKENSKYFPLQLNLEITPVKAYTDSFKRLLKEAKTDKRNGIEIRERNLDKNIKHYPTPTRETTRKVYYIEKDKANTLTQILLRNIEESEYAKEYDFIKVDLIDKDKETFNTLTFCAGLSNKCYSRNKEKYPTFIKNGKQFLSGFTSFSEIFLPSYLKYFSTGSAKIKVVLKLTREEITQLRDIKVYFSN